MPPTSFLDLILPGARAAQAALRVPASITLAQAALESSWGQRAPGNNLFGIKADASWAGPTTDFATHEFINGISTPMVQKFRAYPSMQDSVYDHAKFICQNKRYAACFKEATAEGWARALQAAGYATDPDYAKKLCDIIRFRNLKRFDQ